VAGNAARYGADGYVLWADGTDLTPTTTPAVIRLDVDGVDDACGKVEFNVIISKLRIEVKRSDNKAFNGDVDATITNFQTHAGERLHFSCEWY
jgi:hypothetical protein